MLSAKNATTMTLGTWGAPAARVGSIAADAATSPTKATNHGIACRAPTNSSAPNGAVTAHSDTAEEVAKPPRLHCSAKGSSRLIHSWLRRNNRQRHVRANL